jgi:3-oxoadipate enol-lactonase
MPMITTDDGCPINVEVSGREGAPALMLSNSLGTNLHMWDDQAPEFEKHFRLIRWDRRGHGKSGTTKGPYNFSLFGKDIVKILDTLNIDKVNWCGLSMGGMDGQWLGANAADRVLKLVLANTNFYYADKGPWADRIKTVREHGLKHIVGMNMERWFTKGFRDRAPDKMAWMTEMFLASNLDGYIGCVEAVRDMDFRDSNPRITTPTLVIVGKHDPATPPAAGEQIAKTVKNGKLVALDAAHISNVEQPKAFTDAVLNFLLN